MKRLIALLGRLGQLAHGFADLLRPWDWPYIPSFTAVNWGPWTRT